MDALHHHADAQAHWHYRRTGVDRDQPTHNRAPARLSATRTDSRHLPHPRRASGAEMLTRWRLLLVAAMAATVVLVVAVPPLGHGIFLLDESPLRVAVAALIGGGGAVLVELTHRAVVRPTAAAAVPSRRG